MAINFPSSPTLNQTFTSGSSTWKWDGTSWTSVPASSFTNVTFVNPTITNYTETAYAPSAGSAFTIDLANGTIQKFTSNANMTLTLPSSVNGKSYTIAVVYGGAHSLTWAGGSTIKWDTGSTPTATSVSGKIDIFTFVCDGTNTYGSVFGQGF